MEEEFAVRVRAGPPPAARLLPSERRYSASTALGLALVHLALAALAALLLVALWRTTPPDPPATTPHPEDTALRAAAAALAAAALLPAAAGLLAWHRWYEDRNIRWLLGAAAVSAAGALASLATTSAALASAHERYAELRLGLGPAVAVAVAVSVPTPATASSRPSAVTTHSPLGLGEPSQFPSPAHNASRLAPHPEATVAGGEAPLGAGEEGGAAYEPVPNASSGPPAPTEADPSPHVFLFPGVHSPVDPEDENGTFQTIWKHLSGDVGIAHPTNPVQKDGSDDQAGTTTLVGTDAGSEPYESTHSPNHSPPEESHIPLTENYYHMDDYDEMESDGSFLPTWQHDVRIVPTTIPPTHVSYMADGEEVEHVEMGDETPPHKHATGPLVLSDAPSADGLPAGSALQRRRRADADAKDTEGTEDAEDAAPRPWDTRAAVSLVLSLNLLAAALAEFAWSLWTLAFAWRGARSGYPGDEDRPSSPSSAPRPLAAAAAAAAAAARVPPASAAKHAPGAPVTAAHAQHLHKLRRPDLISNHQQKDPILQETTMPYQERVRRFLASETPVSAETQIE